MKHTKATTSLLSLMLFPMFLTAILQALTPKEQADAFYVRGTAAEQAGALLSAEKCYQLALRVIPGHSAAQAKLKELSVKLSDPFKNMILDRVQFSDASLPEVIEYLRRKLVEVNQGSHKIDFVFTYLRESRPITINFRNASLGDVLKAVCDQGGMQYRVEETNQVVIFPVGSQPPLKNPVPSPAAAAPGPTTQAAPAGELLSWTNTSGKTLKATFVRLEGGEAVLKTAEGKEFRYPIASLNPAGQAQARSLGKKISSP